MTTARLVIFLLGSLTVAAHAQPAQQTPLEQALSAKLMNEINTSLVCSSEMVKAIAKMQELEKSVNALKAKYEPAPKSDEKKK